MLRLLLWSRWQCLSGHEFLTRLGSALLIRIVPFKLLGLGIFIFLVLHHAPTWTWFVSIIFAKQTINLGGLIRRRWLHVLSPDKTTTAEDEAIVI